MRMSDVLSRHTGLRSWLFVAPMKRWAFTLRAAATVALFALAALICFLSTPFLSGRDDVRQEQAELPTREGSRSMLDKTSQLAHLANLQPSAWPASSPAGIVSSTATAQAQGGKPAKRVALAFFGLTRSLQYTIDSIKQNIHAPLLAAGIEYDVYLHTYDLTVINNERSGEQGQGLNTTEWKLLEPDFVQITSQDEFKRKYQPSINSCKAKGDYYKDGFTSVTNLMCQLNSIRLVTAMWRSSGHTYDAVLYLRPDVLYNCPIPVARILDLQPDTVYVPDFHHWRGLNDRFALAEPKAAALWGDRLYFTLAVCTRHQVHAEINVKRLLAHNSLKHELLEGFNFFRVRSMGVVEPKDFTSQWRLDQCDPGMFQPFIARANAIRKLATKKSKAADNKSSA